MISLYIRLAGYFAAATVCVAIGWHLGGLAPKRDLATLQAQDWQGKAQAAAAALVATQAQLKTLQDTDEHNQGVIKDLTDANTKIAADRDTQLDLAHRLLNAAKATSSTGSGAVPKAPSGQGPPGASGTAGDDRLASLLADTASECTRNANRLDALSAEITPQLGP